MAETMKATVDIKNRFVIILAGGRGERFWRESALLTDLLGSVRLQP
jgi:hypothetical protein